MKTVKNDSISLRSTSLRLPVFLLVGRAEMKTLIVIALIALAPVAVRAQKVNVISDPAADFSRYKTYTWDQGMHANPIVRQHIVAAVDNAMTARGLRKVDTESDLIVSALASTESDLTVTNPSWAPVLNSIATGSAGAAAVKNSGAVDAATGSAKSR